MTKITNNPIPNSNMYKSPTKETYSKKIYTSPYQSKA